MPCRRREDNMKIKSLNGGYKICIPDDLEEAIKNKLSPTDRKELNDKIMRLADEFIQVKLIKVGRFIFEDYQD